MPDIQQSILLASDFSKKWEGLASRSPNGLKYFSVSEAAKLDPNTLLYAYADSGGVATIGWGSTTYRYGENAGKAVKMGDVITKEQADMEHEYEVNAKEGIIRAYFDDFDNLTTNQYAAYIDFAYNAGQGSLLKSDILALENAKAPASEIIAAWKLQNLKDRKGNTPKGLVNRRIDETMLYDGSYNELYSYYLRNRAVINTSLLIALVVLASLSLYLKFVVFKKK